MRSSLVRRLILICGLPAAPGVAYAQEAELSGTVTDTTGAVLPNVFNRPNYTVDTVESSATYLTFVSGQNRTAQVGSRLTF